MFYKFIEKLKSVNNSSIFSYLVFGVLTTAVDWITYKFFAALGMNYIISNILAWICAVIFAFVSNKLIVFKSKNLEVDFVVKEFISFVAARIFSLLLQLAGIALIVKLLGSYTHLPAHTVEDIAKALMSVVVIVSNFVLSKLLVFKHKS